MAVIELDYLSKTFGGFNAVKTLDLKTEDGEFVVLVGPSGCGKTTTIRMIAGLDGATGGAIRIDGEDVTAKGPTDRDVALGRAIAQQPDTLHAFDATDGQSVLAAA